MNTLTVKGTKAWIYDPHSRRTHCWHLNSLLQDQITEIILELWPDHKGFIVFYVLRIIVLEIATQTLKR